MNVALVRRPALCCLDDVGGTSYELAAVGETDYFVKKVRNTTAVPRPTQAVGEVGVEVVAGEIAESRCYSSCLRQTSPLENFQIPTLNPSPSRGKRHASDIKTRASSSRPKEREGEVRTTRTRHRRRRRKLVAHVLGSFSRESTSATRSTAHTKVDEPGN